MPKIKRPLSPERLAQLRQHASQLRLWERAQGRQTGPKTEAGKRASALRPLKHGLRGRDAQAMRRWLASLNEALNRILLTHNANIE